MACQYPRIRVLGWDELWSSFPQAGSVFSNPAIINCVQIFFRSVSFYLLFLFPRSCPPYMSIHNFSFSFIFSLVLSPRVCFRTHHPVLVPPQKGLRTLVVACRHFSPEEYADVDRCLNAARTALQQREERLQEAFSYVERDLQLLGATGVEDKYGSKRINQNILVLSLTPVY